MLHGTSFLTSGRCEAPVETTHHGRRGPFSSNSLCRRGERKHQVFPKMNPDDFKRAYDAHKKLNKAKKMFEEVQETKAGVDISADTTELSEHVDQLFDGHREAVGKVMVVVVVLVGW